MKAIIGIGGIKRSGKSTLGAYLTRAAARRSWVVEEISFAQPIKYMLQELFKYEVPYSTFIDDDRKQDKVEIVPGVYMTVRELLQQVGTDCFRDHIHRDFWVARGMHKIKASPADIVIVPDVRFANELVPLKEAGHTIFVEKLGDDQPIDPHPSEMELSTIKSEFDYLVQAPAGHTGILQDWADEFILRL